MTAMSAIEPIPIPSQMKGFTFDKNLSFGSGAKKEITKVNYNIIMV